MRVGQKTSIVMRAGGRTQIVYKVVSASSVTGTDRAVRSTRCALVKSAWTEVVTPTFAKY
jgi:hypothetical protein